MTSPDYNSTVFDAWRTANRSHWQAYTQHSFVHKLGDGSLPKSSFINYLIQDYVFLVHFSKAWALAAVKSNTLDELRIASGTVDALVNHEMQLHVETCANEGISEQQLFDAVEEPENMAYTRFVLATGLSGDFLDLMAALAPCVLGYGEIGHTLITTANKETTYKDWIETYGGTEYQDVCKNVGEMLNNATKSRLGEDFQESPRWSELCQTFGNATRLEVGFWEMASRTTS